jgi:two-component sensor histidine kinase
MTSHEQDLAAAVEELECANASLVLMAAEKAQAIAERDEAIRQMLHRVGNMAQCTLATLRLIQDPPKGMTLKELMERAEDSILRLADDADEIVTDTLGRGMAA